MISINFNSFANIPYLAVSPPLWTLLAELNSEETPGNQTTLFTAELKKLKLSDMLVNGGVKITLQSM